MSRPTMEEIYRARIAEEATAPLLAKPPSVPALVSGFADLDVDDDMHEFMKANRVRERIDSDLVRLASTAHGGKAMVSMLVGARSPAFGRQLDQPDAYRAFPELSEVWAVVLQKSDLKSWH